MSERIIEVSGCACRIQVYQAARNIWIAVGEYLGEHLRTRGSPVFAGEPDRGRRPYTPFIHMYRSPGFVAGLFSDCPQRQVPLLSYFDMPVVFPARPA
jgi:hypothetical protein